MKKDFSLSLGAKFLCFCLAAGGILVLISIYRLFKYLVIW